MKANPAGLHTGDVRLVTLRTVEEFEARTCASSNMKNDIIIVDGFYRDPIAVRNYAISELKQNYYKPYGSEA